MSGTGRVSRGFKPSNTPAPFGSRVCFFPFWLFLLACLSERSVMYEAVLYPRPAQPRRGRDRDETETQALRDRDMAIRDRDETETAKELTFFFLFFLFTCWICFDHFGVFIQWTLVITNSLGPVKLLCYIKKKLYPGCKTIKYKEMLNFGTKKITLLYRILLYQCSL